jgi:ribosomal-protein-alanine N-acetyltransferase
MIVAWLIVDEVHVATLATHPDFRRQGIAKRLLAYTLRGLIEEGAVSSFLEVRESNLAAQDMYRKFGYEATARRRRYYRDNDEDAILMTLDSLDAERLNMAEERSTLDTEERNER